MATHLSLVCTEYTVTYTHAHTQLRPELKGRVSFEGEVSVDKYKLLLPCVNMFGWMKFGAEAVSNCQLDAVSPPSCGVNHSLTKVVITSHINPKPGNAASCFFLILGIIGESWKSSQ